MKSRRDYCTVRIKHSRSDPEALECFNSSSKLGLVCRLVSYIIDIYIYTWLAGGGICGFIVQHAAINSVISRFAVMFDRAIDH